MLRRVGITLVLGIAALRTNAAGQIADEYQVKAAFLYNIAKFVEWPAEVFKTAKDPIVVCVAGQSPITGSLESATSGKTIESRSFVVRVLSDLRQANSCHILFVSATERKHVQPVLLDSKAYGVLTVGEADDFVAEGGIVNLKLRDGKIRIQINVETATQRRLQISSKLLSLADIVKK